MEAATKCRKSILPGPTCPGSLIHVAALHPYGVGLFQDHPLRLFPSNPLLGDLGGRTSKLTRTACAAQRHGNNRECVKQDDILDVGTSGRREARRFGGAIHRQARCSGLGVGPQVQAEASWNTPTSRTVKGGSRHGWSLGGHDGGR
jgi:hypothetical protein